MGNQKQFKNIDQIIQKQDQKAKERQSEFEVDSILSNRLSQKII
ncbi:unnamed protein product [Paramecium octaurelia]|uniref:Uncharacterized protein n=1 Tax=Paramecium octaurelia TaxID=43137 RepID=A0A8S1XLT6_PAROT|nr:unnamed protein product [Paramecium octaurelia]